MHQDERRREKKADKPKERNAFFVMHVRVYVFGSGSGSFVITRVFYTYIQKCFIMQSTVRYSLLKEPFSKHRFTHFGSLSSIFCWIFFRLRIFGTFNSTFLFCLLCVFQSLFSSFCCCFFHLWPASTTQQKKRYRRNHSLAMLQLLSLTFILFEFLVSHTDQAIYPKQTIHISSIYLMY